MYYKEPVFGRIHYIDSSEHEYLLPFGCVQITDAEAIAMQTPTLNQIKAERIAAINAACAAAITGGFTSSALGDVHSYDSAETDQLNLIGAVALAVSLPYTCADSLGSKIPRQHTVSQLKQVMSDGAAFKLALLSKCAGLKAQIAAAQTLADLDVVVW